MAEPFLTLAREERGHILASAAQRLGRDAKVLEKDVWVCWVLAQLFSMPGRLRMAFKGGTSLSKVHDAISRFSEDVDVTLDYRDLKPGCDPFSCPSRAREKKLREELEHLVKEHIARVVIPHFERTLTEDFGEGNCAVLLSEGENVRILYPTAVEGAAGYVDESILLEFGGRNAIDPHEPRRVEPYLASLEDLGQQLVFPVADVQVLSAERTFWEKATLIHAECRDPRGKGDRLSRHWYDLAQLADHAVGKGAVANRALLEDVVRHKSVIYRRPGADYEACLKNELVLVPGGPLLAALHDDYRRMVGAGMFEGTAPSFAAILDRLQRLQSEVNSFVAPSDPPT